MNLALQPFLLPEPVWTPVRDGNRSALALFSRHYSRYVYADGRDPSRFVGPGERIVLLTADASALLVWRKFRSMDAQVGVNCSVFRNEGTVRSSELLLAAMAIAWARWPGERLYTYVNPRRVASANPGYCFLCAGWRRCGTTKRRGLLVLEALPDTTTKEQHP